MTSRSEAILIHFMTAETNKKKYNVKYIFQVSTRFNLLGCYRTSLPCVLFSAFIIAFKFGLLRHAGLMVRLRFECWGKTSNVLADEVFVSSVSLEAQENIQFCLYIIALRGVLAQAE